MLKRILTALIGLVVFFTVVLTHHYVLYTAVGILIFGMLYEMYRVITVGRFLKLTGYLSGLVIWLGYLFGVHIFAMYTVCILFMLAMIAMHGKVSAKKVLSVGFITLFISVCMMALVLIRRKCDQYTLILPFIVAWLTDTGAYFAGSLFGKHKLAPNISPKKTVEGAVGGLVLAVLGSVAYIFIMVAIFAGSTPIVSVIIRFAVLGLVGSIIAQLGDLALSCIKRDFKKKDYGAILPGHGGILDRFDSVLFVTPVVYYMMLYIIL